MIELIDKIRLQELVKERLTWWAEDYDVGDIYDDIVNAPVIKPPMGYQPIEGGWAYYGLPEGIERVIYCQNCEYYNGHEQYCSNDHFAREWGYCHSASRRYDEDESN